MTSKKITLAVVSRNFGDVGGAEYFAARLTEGVAADPGFEVHVFTSRPYSGSANITIHLLPQPIGPRFLQKPLFAWIAGRALAGHTFDLIHTHEPLAGAHFVTYGTPHQFWTKEVRKKRGSGPYDWTTLHLERSMFEHPNCRQVLPMSNLVAQLLEQSYPSLTNRLTVLEPGIDPDRFTSLEQRLDRSEFRARFKVQANDKVGLFIGNNYEHKGLARILEALSLEQTGEYRLKLWVLGRGDIARYTRLAKDLGIGDRVHFAGLVRENVEEWMLGADFLISLSAFETFGMVVLEALAAGLPVLVSEQTGAKDLVQNGQSGVILDSVASPLEIAQAMKQLSTSPVFQELRLGFRESAREHTWQRSAGQLKELYRAHLDSKP